MTEAAFARIQQGIFELREPGEDVMLVGDLNARLSSAQHDKHRASPADLPASSVSDVPDLDQLAALQAFMGLLGDADIQDYGGVPARRSEDPVCNFTGHQLGSLGRSFAGSAGAEWARARGLRGASDIP